jgi:hypothetical protein
MPEMSKKGEKYDLRGEENGEYDDVEDDGDYVDRQADHDLLHPILYSTHPHVSHHSRGLKRHGLINYKDTKTKCRLLVFNTDCRLEIVSVV